MARIVNLTEQTGYKRRANIHDLESVVGTGAISGDNVTLSKIAITTPLCMLLDSNIRSIEFTIPSTLSDNTAHTVIIGEGLESATRVFAYIGFKNNADGFSIANMYASAVQSNSLNGEGRMSSPYLQPEVIPTRIAAGDRVRLTIIDEDILFAQRKPVGESEFKNWFKLDKKGWWVNPTPSGTVRLGWNIGYRFGAGKTTGSTATTFTAFEDLYVWEKNDTGGSELVYSVKESEELLEKSIVETKPKWVAIGDSQTGIDDNNFKSYLGSANSILNYNVVNMGFGGWTIYKLWRDKLIGDGVKTLWTNEILTANIVTIFAGTNDFDTTFVIPADDTAMDAAAHPHPRFGETDPAHLNAKDTHTTLGCLRLTIEYILTNNPAAKIYIITPAYRLLKSIVTGGSLVTWTVNDEGKTIYDYSDAIANVAKEYNLPVVDFMRTAGVNSLNIDTYMYDKLHFNENGGKHYGKILAQKLK